MSQYIICYIGGDQPSSPEEGKKHFAKYQEWLASLGESVLSPMNPFKNTHTLKGDTVAAKSDTSMSGYTVIEADSIEAALALTKTHCPHNYLK
jgi:predicted transcriptional regulator